MEGKGLIIFVSIVFICLVYTIVWLSRYVRKLHAEMDVLKYSESMMSETAQKLSTMNTSLQKVHAEREKEIKRLDEEVVFQRSRFKYMDAMMRSLGRYTASTANLWVMRPYITAKACITQRHDATIKMVDSNYIPLISGLDLQKYPVSEHCTDLKKTNIFQGTAWLPGKWDNFFGHVLEYKSFYNAEMYLPKDITEVEREALTKLMLEPDVNDVFFSLFKSGRVSFTGNMVYIGQEKQHIRWFGISNLESKVPDMWHAFLTAIGACARSETHLSHKWTDPANYRLRTSNDQSKAGPVFAEFMMVTSTNQKDTDKRDAMYRTLVH